MKPGIHPEYVECTVTCSCGNTFKTHATKPEIRVEICNACHPFYTGQQKFVDTGGRVQRFANKFGSASASVAEREEKRKAERAQAALAAEEKRKAERAAKAAEKEKRAQEYAARAEKEAKKDAEAAAKEAAEKEAAEKEAAGAEVASENTAEENDEKSADASASEKAE